MKKVLFLVTVLALPMTSNADICNRWNPVTVCDCIGADGNANGARLGQVTSSDQCQAAAKAVGAAYGTMLDCQTQNIRGTGTLTCDCIGVDGNANGARLGQVTSADQCQSIAVAAGAATGAMSDCSCQ